MSGRKRHSRYLTITEIALASGVLNICASICRHSRQSLRGRLRYPSALRAREKYPLMPSPTASKRLCARSPDSSGSAGRQRFRSIAGNVAFVGYSGSAVSTGPTTTVMTMTMTRLVARATGGPRALPAEGMLGREIGAGDRLRLMILDGWCDCEPDEGGRAKLEIPDASFRRGCDRRRRRRRHHHREDREHEDREHATDVHTTRLHEGFLGGLALAATTASASGPSALPRPRGRGQSPSLRR